MGRLRRQCTAEPRSAYTTGDYRLGDFLVGKTQDIPQDHLVVFPQHGRRHPGPTFVAPDAELVDALDTLGLENSIARARTLGYLVGVAAKLLEVGELEERLAYLEAAVLVQKALAEPVFDAEFAGSDFSAELADD